jgi:hypothetical protein
MSGIIKYTIVCFALIIFTACQTENEDQSGSPAQAMQGDYLGLDTPRDTAKIFAPGFISTNLYTRDLVFYPDGKEIYFCVSGLGFNLIFETKQDDQGIWSEPEPASFISDYSYMYYEPTISPDGSKLYFLSNITDTDSIAGDQDIWYVDRIEGSWGEPKNVGEPINTAGAEFFPSFTKDHTMYFTRQPEGEQEQYIFRSKFTNGAYTEPEKLPDAVNIGTARFNAFISPDEDYIIVPATRPEDSFGGVDYYIIFRNDNDEWSEPINMGEQLNSESMREYSTSLSHDGKFIFFMSNRGSGEEMKDFTLSEMVSRSNDILNGNSNIYWISSDIIEKLKIKITE